MGLKCFTEEAQERLIANIDVNIENGNYLKKESWIEEFFEGEEYTFESTIDVELPDLIELKPEESNSMSNTKYDFENSKILYFSFKDLDFEQVTNPKLWNYLMHTKYWTYVTKRWALKEDSELKTSRNLLNDRYISKVGTGKILLRNALTGLWWLSYTTYDENEEDKFIHTKRLLNSADFHVGLMERNFSRNKDFVLNFMRGLRKFENKDRDGKLISTKEHRELFKEINLIGGIKILDTLDENDLYKIIYDFFEEQ